MDAVLVDYSEHLLEIRKLTSELHNVLLKNNFEEGINVANKIVGEARLLRQSLSIMQEVQCR